MQGRIAPLRRQLRNQHQKLIPTGPCHHRPRGQQLANALGQGGQKSIACLVPQGVIDGLEVIHIQIQQGPQPVAGHALGLHLGQDVHKRLAVGQAGEGIGRGQAVNVRSRFALGLLARFDFADQVVEDLHHVPHLGLLWQGDALQTPPIAHHGRQGAGGGRQGAQCMVQPPGNGQGRQNADQNGRKGDGLVYAVYRGQGFGQRQADHHHPVGLGDGLQGSQPGLALVVVLQLGKLALRQGIDQRIAAQRRQALHHPLGLVGGQHGLGGHIGDEKCALFPIGLLFNVRQEIGSA